MRILVVDDEPAVRDSMRLLLELDGHTTEEAPNGTAALVKADAGRFDLVFTDYMMPEMRGDQLARELRRRECRAPIVMVSGTPPVHALAHISRVIAKPFTLSCVRSVLTSLAE